MEMSQGFKKFASLGDWIIEMLRTIYGTKQAAKRYWLFMLGIFLKLKYEYNRVDLCLYYKWIDDGIILWTLWVDDLLLIGANTESVVLAKRGIPNILSCDDTGEVKEYVGCKLDID